LIKDLQEPSRHTVLSEGLQDVFWVIREEAILALEKIPTTYLRIESIIHGNGRQRPKYFGSGSGDKLLFEKGGSRYKSIFE
jgi:hypothetical protein